MKKNRSSISARVLSPSLLKLFLRPRRNDANKGDFGHVLVLAGSRGMTGAARLCAAAALRSGAGLVTLGVPQSEYAVVARDARWEVMTKPFPSAAQGTFSARAFGPISDFIRDRKVTSLVLGPGLGVNPQTVRLVKKIIGSFSIPIVLDADGLNVLAAAGWPENISSPLIMTPHPGELARLLNTNAGVIQRNRIGASVGLSRACGIVCVLKGQRTVITDGRRVFINPTGNPGMATGGTGDVLSGIVAALIAQTSGMTVGERMFQAALAGVYVHGSAGDLAARRRTRLSMAAGDIIDFLPQAFRRIFGKRI